MSFVPGRDGTVTITAVAFSPRVAVDLANTYVEVLLSKSSSFARQQARGTRDLLENLWSQARANQTEAEDALRRYQAKLGGSLKLPEESRIELTSLANLETQLNDLQINREIAQNKLAYLKGDKKKPGGMTLAADPALQALRERLTQLEAKLAALTEKYTDQHPSVQNVQADIHETQQRLAAALQPQQSPRPGGAQVPLRPLETAQLSKQMATLDVEIVTLQAKEDTLQERANRLRRSLSAMSGREQEYSGLLRAVMTQTKLTDMLSDKLTAARISERSQIRSIHVIDLANLPRQPSPRQPMKLLLFGLVGGLGLGIGAATLREYMTQIVETEQEVIHATGLPVLGSIPIAERPGLVVNGAPEGLPVLFGGGDAFHSLPADACRAIRTALDCQSLNRPLKTLLITSPGAHEGKSTVLLNLGRAFLESDRQLLASGLDFMPAGTRRPNPSRLLSSKHTTTLLQEARDRADLVLIDAPPVLAVADCLPLCRQVDGVILVIRFGSTRRRSLQRAKDQLQKVGAHVVGVVINGLSRRETRHYYAEYTQYVGIKKRRRKGNKPK